jgi:DNA-binding transcriptional LysR family regulator
MAQPNLSKAVKELEDSIGFPIFERNSKGVIPTPKGVEFLAHARNILEQVSQIASLADPDDYQCQNFTVSIPRGSYIAEGFIRFAAELNTEQDINVNVQETNSMEAIHSVAEGRFKLGIIRYMTVYENYFLDYLQDKELSYDPIWEFEYVALMSNYHPLALADEILYHELFPYIEIVHGDTRVPYLDTTTEIKKHSSGDPPRKRIRLYERCNQFELLRTLQTTYMWVSPIPERVLKLYGLTQRKCVFTNNHSKDLLIYPKGYAFSALDRKFIEKLYESKNAVSCKK